MKCHKPAFENNKIQKLNFGNGSDERVQEEEDSVSSKHSQKPDFRKPASIADSRVSMSEDKEDQNKHALANQALDRLEAAAVKNPLASGPRESMLTGAIDFGGFSNSINRLGSLTGQTQFSKEANQKPKYEASLDLNEILDDENEE